MENKDCVFRGGSWHNMAWFCSSACRLQLITDASSRVIGFRFILREENIGKRVEIKDRGVRGGGWLNAANECRSDNGFQVFPCIPTKALSFRLSALRRNKVKHPVIRGGAHAEFVRRCRSSGRIQHTPTIFFRDISFRLTARESRHDQARRI